MKTYPLSQSQLSIYRAWHSRPDEVEFNLPTCITLDNTIDLDRLQAALQHVIARRSALHTCLGVDPHGEPCQWTDLSLVVPVERLTLTDDEAHRYITRRFVRPFATTGQALCRFALVETSKTSYLLLDLHHIIADGMTIARLLIGRDLEAAYNGRELVPDTEPGVWAAAEKALAGSETHRTAREFHRRLLNGVTFTRLPLLEDGTDYRATYATARVDNAAVRTTCASGRVSVNTLMLTAFSIVLSKITRCRQVAFFALTHGRRGACRDAYGMFVQSLPVVVDVDAAATAGLLCRQVATRLTGAMRHSAHSTTELCRELNIMPAITFGYQGPGIEETRLLAGHRITGHQLPSPTSRHDLCCTVYEHGAALELRLESHAGRMSSVMLKGIADGMACVVRQMVADPDRPVGRLSTVDDEGTAQLLRQGRGTVTGDNPSATWLDLFDTQVRRVPDRQAVVDGNSSMTYAELDRLARQVAARLVAGAPQAHAIAVQAHRHCSFVAAVIGCWRAGKAYLPLEPSLPVERQRALLAHSGAIPLPGNEVRLAMASTPPPGPDSTAYVMYTSGSAGLPKGVAVSHRALLNLTRHVARHWPVTESSRIACHSSLSFDASVEDLFPVLAVGGTLFLVPDEVRLDLDRLAAYLTRNGITGGCMTTRLGVQLLQRHPSLPLDYLCLGGEALTMVPRCRPRVLNTYGPTEGTVNATWCEVRHDDRTITIGRPLDNTLAAVMDPDGHLLPCGLTGELWLAGPQLADGYLHDSQQTAKRFVESSVLGCRAYRTGDLVRWTEDGQLVFVGRCDRQLKWHGFRIEPGEVEATLCRLLGVRDAVVTLRDDQLCAHYVADATLPPETLRKRLSRLLPHYMIPVLWRRVDRLPIGLHDKVDPSLLPEPHPLTVPYEAPSTPAERLWCEVFAQALGLRRVGVDDDFFALGGTSLSVAGIVDRARQRGVTIAYSDVFDHPTPRRLAGRTDNKNPRPAAPAVPRLSQREIRPAERCLVTGASGFLGIHVVHRLLEHTGATVTAFVRDRARIADAWRYYFDRELPTARLHLVVGDLTRETSLRDLPDVDLVVHCAALVNQYAPGGQLERVNVDGTRNLALWCAAHAARLVHISTRSVAGMWPVDKTQPPFDELCLDIGQRLPNAYVRSKFAAECEVLSMVADGRLDALVLRVGNLTPRAHDGRYLMDASGNAFASALRLFKTMGCYPRSLAHEPVDRSPVDLTARAVVLLAQAATGYCVLHPFDNRLTMWSELPHLAGLTACDDSEWVGLLPPGHDSAVVAALLPEDDSHRPTLCDNALTTTLLEHLGFTW